VIAAAANAGVPVVPRGAGTGLAGGAIGRGLVIDFSRHNRDITDFNRDARTVRVGAGVVLDQLNDFLRPHGLGFGPDVAPSSRATLGGMIANDSSGAHCPVHGTTGGHVNELEIVLASGRIVSVRADNDTLAAQRELLESLVTFNALTIAERLPPGLIKRRPGYALDRAVHSPRNLLHLLAGSEGTLAAITSAELKLVPLPRVRGLAVICFASVAEAMQASAQLLDLQPAAVEHIDRLVFGQTRGQIQFQAARDLLQLDALPCESMLLVEFYGNHERDVAAQLGEVARRKFGLRTLVTRTQAEADLVWGIRKAGLSLVTACKGNRKPVNGIDDVAVRPADLPAYVAGLQKILGALNLEASFYGHAAAGLLHVQPALDLHLAEDVAKYRTVADEVAALTKQFKGAIAGEHGLGICRTEFLHDQVGDEIYGLMRQMKHAFDPHNIFNPGKIIDDGRYKFDRDLRIPAGSEIKLPFTPRLAFAAKDESFVGNLEQCNGCGGCRKATATMCPTFVATGDEIMSTRGRANIIRAALEHRGGIADPLACDEMEAALENCLACKACTSECPSGVNLALLKAELQHARIRRDGLGLRRWLFSNVDWFGQIGCAVPTLANWALNFAPLKFLNEKLLGLAATRHLPRYTSERFDVWFNRRVVVSKQSQPTSPSEPLSLTPALSRWEREKHSPLHGKTESANGSCDSQNSETNQLLSPLPAGEGQGEGERDHQPKSPAQHFDADFDADFTTAPRGRVILWDDTFVRYHEPHIGKAAVKVLEAAGFTVTLAHGRQCCGRPAFSQGHLDAAAKLGAHNLALLRDDDAPVIFLEPSCYSMFAEDYRELKLPDAEKVAARCVLFEEFIANLLDREPAALQFSGRAARMLVHAHCHAKSLADVSYFTRLAAHIPGWNATLLDTGCCGMAGGFGMMASKQELSLAVAAPLMEKLSDAGSGKIVVATGTSCRHQIAHCSHDLPRHLAEVLAEALA
ncbi:MAG: Anaerobic glycerol-3-phosphate dehydrogenase subunit, partial [Verrucomicrobiota bacterium]